MLYSSPMNADVRPNWPTQVDLTVPDFPPVVLLDLTNVCNLSCIHCEQPNMRIQKDYNPQMMNLYTFKRIADECSLHPTSLMRIIGDGEPLLVKDLPEMIEYAKGVGVRPIGITTAGFHLDEEKSRRFLRAGIDFIDFSLDAYSREKYDEIRKGSNYHRVVGNIHRFLELRGSIQNSRYTGDRTKVLVNMVDQPQVHDEIKAFKRHWEPLVDRVFVRPLHSVVGLVEVSNPTLDQEIERWPCRYFWERLEISPDGRVAHCSQAWGRESAYVGDINKETLSEIWHGSTMQELRRNHQANSFLEKSLCGPCKDWKTISWDPSKTYSAHIKTLLG